VGTKALGQHILLNNILHQDLRLITRRGSDLGDSVNQVLIFPSEYIEIQRHYPIFIQQTEAGGFKSVALLGFDKDENLFLEGDQWTVPYIPAMQRISPFLIGQPTPPPGENLPADAEAMILVDPDHVRISTKEGEPLFLAHGGHSPTLVHVTQTIHQVFVGSKLSDPMFSAFLEAGLLAPVQIDVKLDDQKSYMLNDMFTISREGLQRLEADQLKSLNQMGFLALAFYIASSLSNLSHMITLKNKRSAGSGS